VETCPTGDPVRSLSARSEFLKNGVGVIGDRVTFIQNSHFGADKPVDLYISRAYEGISVLAGAKPAAGAAR
jgi:hypothetical protein